MPQFAMLTLLILFSLQMLSGGQTPRESMPQLAQYAMELAPSTHFVELGQAILFRGAGLDVVWPQLLALGGIGVVFFTVALTRFRNTISLMATLLIVDDDAELGDFLAEAFERDEYRVTRTSGRVEARTRLQKTDIHVALLEADSNGQHLDWFRAVRAAGHTLPVIVIFSRRSTASRRVEALDAGADDVIGRPFAIAELRARVRALGRRPALPHVPELTLGAVRLQATTRRAWVGPGEVALTAREWSELDLIIDRRGGPIPRAQILAKRLRREPREPGCHRRAYTE